MHKQKGMTMISWVVVISFLGIVAVSALNIIPSYLNFMTAKSVLENLETDSVVRGKTAIQIKGIINDRFRSNSLRNIDVKKAISFKNQGASNGSGYIVELDYEDRGKIIGNLYFVTVFHHAVSITP